MHIPFFSKYFVRKKDFDELARDCEVLIKDYELLSTQYESMKKMNEILSVATESPTKAQKDKVNIPVAGFDSTDDEPIEITARQEYVKNVDFFMDAVLNNKLKCSIADIREMLSNVGVAQGLPQNMQRNEYDFFLRGMEAFAWKMHEWATRLQGERRSQLQDKENS